MKTFHFPVVVEIDEVGIYIVSCPMFKGCNTAGNNIDFALNNLDEVLEICIDDNLI